MFGRSRLYDVSVTIHRPQVDSEPVRVGNDWLYDEERCEKISAMANVQPRSSSSDRLAVGRNSDVQDDGAALPFYSFVMQTPFKLQADDVIVIEKEKFTQAVRPFTDVVSKGSYTMTLLKKL